MARLAILLLGLIPLALAHGGVSNYTVGDTWYRGYSPDAPASTQEHQPWLIQRTWASINPIFSPTNTSLSCNTPGHPAPSSIPIRAGQNISAVYYSWLHTYGPMVVWMADCGGDCRAFNSSEARWFKIWEAGLLSGSIGTGTWYQQLWADGGFAGQPTFWNATVPERLRAGAYLVRHEIIAIHVANKPQWYAECAHLEVEGDGEEVPPEQYYGSIPGVYSMDQPEINIDIFSNASAHTYVYNIPGPPVWTGEERRH